MRPIAPLALFAALIVAAPALSAPVPSLIDGAQAAQASPQNPPPTEADIEAAAQAFGLVVQDMETRAAALRADPSLSAEDRELRIMALIAERQPEILAFLDLLQAFVVGQATADGMPADEALAQAEAIRQNILVRLIQSLLEGPQASAAAAPAQ